jgi:hypothetical protein
VDPEVDRANGEAAGLAYRDGDPSAVLTVDGVAVTGQELALRRANVEANIEFMATVMAGGGPTASGVQDRLELIQAYGPGTVALSAVIHDAALHAMVVEQGLTIDPAEITDSLDSQRSAIQSGDAPGQAAFVEAVGEDFFWNVYLPEVVQRGLLVSKLRAAELEGVTSHEEGVRGWTAFETDAVNSAVVNLADGGDVSQSDVAEAVSYWMDYTALVVAESS